MFVDYCPTAWWGPRVLIKVVLSFQYLIGGFCGIDAGGAEHIQRVLSLGEKFIPELEGKISVGGA